MKAKRREPLKHRTLMCHFMRCVTCVALARLKGVFSARQWAIVIRVTYFQRRARSRAMRNKRLVGSGPAQSVSVTASRRGERETAAEHELAPKIHPLSCAAGYCSDAWSPTPTPPNRLGRRHRRRSHSAFGVRLQCRNLSASRRLSFYGRGASRAPAIITE